MNFYAMKNNSGVAWSPILGQGNFHKASRFGKVFWTKTETTQPAASASAPKLIHLRPLGHVPNKPSNQKKK
jgi:hypothetical protein